jgi:hypothetical protein
LKILIAITAVELVCLIVLTLVFRDKTVCSNDSLFVDKKTKRLKQKKWKKKSISKREKEYKFELNFDWTFCVTAGVNIINVILIYIITIMTKKS